MLGFVQLQKFGCEEESGKMKRSGVTQSRCATEQSSLPCLSDGRDMKLWPKGYSINILEIVIFSQTTSWSRRERNFHFPLFNYFQQYKNLSARKKQLKRLFKHAKTWFEVEAFSFLQNFSATPPRVLLLAEENVWLSKKKKKKISKQKTILSCSLWTNTFFFLESERELKKLFPHLADFIPVSSLIY